MMGEDVGRSDWSAGGFSKDRETPKIIQKRSLIVIQQGNSWFWGIPILRNTQLARANCVDYLAICFETLTDCFSGGHLWKAPPLMSCVARKLKTS